MLSKMRRDYDILSLEKYFSAMMMEETFDLMSIPDTIYDQIDFEVREDRRELLMIQMNIYDPSEQQPEPTWTQENHDHNQEEDLLNIKIPDKVQDVMVNTNGQRLIVHDVTVQNFKSYRGTHQLGPFHKNLTMILGPNGSGKSNVIDAILFGFGFKANKIRTNKLSSLINAGSNAAFCLVEVHFEMIKDIDEEKFTVIPGTRFKISRAVYKEHKEGTSVFKINDVVCTQKEVTDLLCRAGIDLAHNRFLIAQGEVEIISQMKPTAKGPNEEGMLEYIEDIVGTNRFVDPIAKLNVRVAYLEFKLSRFHAGLRRIQIAEKTFLPAMEAATAYVNCLNQIVYSKAMSRKHTLANLIETRNSAQSQLDVDLDRLAAKEEIFKEVHEKFIAARQEEDDAAKAENEASNKNYDMEQQIALRNEEWNKTQNELKNALADVVKYTDNLRQYTAEYQAAMEVPQKARDKLQSMETELEQLRQREDTTSKLVTAGLMNFDKRTAPDQQKKRELAADYEKKNQEYLAIRSDFLVLQDEVNDCTRSAGIDRKRLENTKETLANLEAELEKDETEQAEKTAQLAEYETQSKEIHRQLPDLRSSESAFRLRKANVQRQIKELSNCRQPTKYKHHATAALQRLKDDGQFPGFIGRLGDLARVDKKYDAVMSTVFGACLDLHIVQTGADASKGIDYLHKKRIARTNFFFLDHVNQLDSTGMEHSPVNLPAPRLFDILQCDSPEIRAVYYQSLQDTVVCENLTEAQKVDKKLCGKVRVVCLDASVIDRSGSLTGGGHPVTGRIRTDDAPPDGSEKTNKLASLRSQLEKITKDLMTMESRVQDAEALLEKIEPEIPILRERVAQLNRQIPPQREKIIDLTQSIRTQERLIRSLPEVSLEDLEDKRTRLAAIKSTLDAAKKDAEEAKALSERQNAKVDKIYVETVNKKKELCDKYKNQIEELEVLVAKEQAAVQNAPQYIETARKKVEEAKKDLEKSTLEAQRLELLESRDGAKQTSNLSRELQKQKVILDQAHKKLLECRALRQEIEEQMKKAGDERAVMKDTVRQVRDCLDRLNMQYDDEKEQLEIIEGQWVEPDDLDPSVKLIRRGEDKEETLRELEQEDAVLMPPEVAAKLIDYKTLYDQAEMTVLPAHDVKRLRDDIVALEYSAEDFRIKYDEKGISQYALIQLLKYNDSHSCKKYIHTLTVHRKKLNELKTARFTEFSEALAFLGTTTQMLYQLITNGGDASLKFVEEGKSSDPFEAGIKFSVRPAKKSWKLIENLSGGEKTLASLCFVFAMHHFRATPLYVMDEIDAALDLNNVRLIANYIKHSERTRNAQFIIISLRNQMFEVGNRLFGVYKTFGDTHNIVVCPNKVESGNKEMLKVLDSKIQEEEKKRKEVADAEAEQQLTRGIKNVIITQKRCRRKLGRLSLKEFGIGDDDDETEDENYEPMCVAGPSSHEETIESDEGEIVIRRKKKVGEEFDDDDDESILESPSPTPPPPPPKPQKATRGRRSKK